MFGEGAGASELIGRVIQVLAYEWTQRGPCTRLTPAMIAYTGAKNLIDLLDGLANDRYQLDASAAPLVFQIAESGDAVAEEVIRWAGEELGELANTVIRQLNFESLEFDVVLIGSMFDGGALLIDPMRLKVQSIAPLARLVRLDAPPVMGAVLLGMEQAGYTPEPYARDRLARSSQLVLRKIRAEGSFVD
jgi:N-acetylglucosamine kinase-like BadF-type ATPase